MLDISVREEGVVTLHLPALGWNLLRDVNPVPTKPFADDMSTV